VIAPRSNTGFGSTGLLPPTNRPSPSPRP
jgi:hypothetical protein